MLLDVRSRSALQRQIDDKVGAVADFAFNTDGAGMCGDDLSGDVKAETKAPKLPIEPSRSKRLKILAWSAFEIPGPQSRIEILAPDRSPEIVNSMGFSTGCI
jgi:hypothetical protein